MEIIAVSFLEGIRKLTGLKFLVYKIRDEDIHKDSKIDFDDVLTLYVSTINGQNFQKLTPKLAQIVD